jgi:hypothetical protein
MGKRSSYIKIACNTGSEASELADAISNVTRFRLSNMRQSEGQVIAFMEDDEGFGDSTS